MTNDPVTFVIMTNAPGTFVTFVSTLASGTKQGRRSIAPPRLITY